MQKPSGLYTPHSGQNLDIDPLRGDFLNNRIPACASMTKFRANKQFEIISNGTIPVYEYVDVYSPSRARKIL